MKNKLETLYKKYNKKNLVSPDPLQFLYNYPDARDRETAGLIAAVFAYGNVKQIIKTVGLILEKTGGPYKFIAGGGKKDFQKTFKNFKYRFTTEDQLINLLVSIKNILEKYGSLENCFLNYYNPAEPDVSAALKGFAKELRSSGAVNTLVPDPEKNSALKRLNLYLRWMVRRDEVDPGGWTKVNPSKLLVPLDVHMHRTARLLGLTKRNQADMKTAVEISAAFAKFCPEDPVKYDFCLTRFGIRDDMDATELNAII